MSANKTPRTASVVLHAIEVLLQVVVIAGVAAAVYVLAQWVKSTPAWNPPAAEVPDGQVLRRLEIRLREPLDKGRGDRYRLFECREVPRERPKAASDAPVGGSARP